MMAFIYLPSVVVQPYLIFGITVLAVESIGADYGTGEVYKIQHGWFNDEFSAYYFAEKIRRGET